ncbi:DUF547 domain-containing protein [Flavobacteriaceae bacterium LMO-SS05]|jgi:hypothetical protein
MNKLVLLLITALTFTSCLDAKGFSIKDLNTFGTEHNVIDHSSWDKLLKKYVADNGDVNYKSFKNDAKTLYNYINYLATKVPSKNWSKQEKLAYFINVYNANTIKLIIDNYPTKSIKDISRPWAKDRIKIGEDNFSLSDIEHNILRKMDEPRIHFAINCASASCPKLLNTAYTSENVEFLLDKAARDFIGDQKKNKLSENRVQLSMIFNWYKSDFTNNGSLIDYINPYSSVKINPKASIDYLDYDWNLNEQH